MSFSISFTGDPDEYLGDDPDVPYAVGRFVAGDFDEEFSSNLYEWSKCDYEAQWLRSLGQLISGDKKVALITHYVNPAESSNLHWWALYRGESGVVYVQDHLRFYDQLGTNFSVSDANRFVADRRTVTEEGNRISEWQVQFSEIVAFVDRIKQQKFDTPS